MNVTSSKLSLTPTSFTRYLFQDKQPSLWKFVGTKDTLPTGHSDDTKPIIQHKNGTDKIEKPIEDINWPKRRKRAKVPLIFPIDETSISMEQMKGEMAHIKVAIIESPQGLTMVQFTQLLENISPFPRFLYCLLWKRIASPTTGLVSDYQLMRFWEANLRSFDPLTRFFNVIKQPNNEFISPIDLIPFIKELLKNHPSLEFLQHMPEFQEKYIETALVRIFYRANRSKNGKMTLHEFKRSDLVTIWKQLEDTQYIEKSCKYFSYEHFYVIYCKFWQLDTNHDMILHPEDLLQYDNVSLSTRIVDRIFEHKPCSYFDSIFDPDVTYGKYEISYHHFVWFILSEVDKCNDTSIEYWFHCVDIDSDGFLSPYELEYFWEEQHERGCDVEFEDIYYQLNDIISPRVCGRITIADIKASKRSSLFFDILFNKNKFLSIEHEENIHYVHTATTDSPSEWDLFAEREYEQAIAQAEFECFGETDCDDWKDCEDPIDEQDSEEILMQLPSSKIRSPVLRRDRKLDCSSAGLVSRHRSTSL